MDQFLCLNQSSERSSARPVLVISAPSWHDARDVAMSRFGVDQGGVNVSKCSGDHRPDIEVRFLGDDFNHGGGVAQRRRQIRERTGDTWGEWANG